jgi:site-specific recombinase XerD
MIHAGIDLYAIGKSLGHASHISTVSYRQVANDRLPAAVEAALQQAVSRV